MSGLFQESPSWDCPLPPPQPRHTHLFFILGPIIVSCSHSDPVKYNSDHVSFPSLSFFLSACQNHPVISQFTQNKSQSPYSSLRDAIQCILHPPLSPHLCKIIKQETVLPWFCSDYTAPLAVHRTQTCTPTSFLPPGKLPPWSLPLTSPLSGMLLSGLSTWLISLRSFMPLLKWFLPSKALASPPALSPPFSPLCLHCFIVPLSTDHHLTYLMFCLFYLFFF